MNTHVNKNLLSFLKTFFITNGCKIIMETNDCISVQLTKQLDLTLMNRPFYWHYMERMGQQGEPMSLTLTTNPNYEQGPAEFIHFGSPRYQQIIKHLQTHETLIKLYESVYTTVNTPLFPWLLTNIKIIYKGNQIREELFSIGLNLINGQMKTNMMNLLDNIPLEQSIADYCHCITPLITLDNGYTRIKEVILNYIKEQDMAWGDNALLAMEKELTMLDYFFTDNEADEQYAIEASEIHERFAPAITLQVISGGIVYLTNQFHEKVE